MWDFSIIVETLKRNTKVFRKYPEDIVKHKKNLTVFAIIAVALLLATNAQAQTSPTGDNLEAGMSTNPMNTHLTSAETSAKKNNLEVNAGTLNLSPLVVKNTHFPDLEGDLSVLASPNSTLYLVAVMDESPLHHQTGLKKDGDLSALAGLRSTLYIMAVVEPPLSGQTMEKKIAPASMALTTDLQGEPGKVSRSMTSAQDDTGTNAPTCANCHSIDVVK
jgi:hypothetical protein